MKKIFNIIKIFLIVLFIILAIVALLKKKEQLEPTVIDVEIDKYADIDELYFYGNHFNIKGSVENKFENIDKVEFVLISKLYKYQYTYELDYHIDDKIYFDTNEYINEGIDLDKVKEDSYIIYIVVSDKNHKANYGVKNVTDYKETTYYSLNNTTIKIQSNEDNILSLNVEKVNEEVYDIIIDPGHGGKDPGACYNGTCETDYTLDLSNILKTKLEQLGYKVILTRTSNVTLDKYGENNRIDKVYTSHAKFALSIHLNSTSIRLDGYELYSSNHTSLTFPRMLISSLNGTGNLKPSNNTHFKVEDGIYVRTFNSTDVQNANEDGVYPNVSTDTNYYLMIRETGGYITGAYVDGRENEGENRFRNTNVGVETFILELGYINNPDNVEEIKNNKDKYLEKVAQSINKYLKKEA